MAVPLTPVCLSNGSCFLSSVFTVPFLVNVYFDYDKKLICFLFVAVQLNQFQMAVGCISFSVRRFESAS